ncbi:MAG: DUF4116 domain-containing protein [Candidatus Margulisiibacteriota bacterium]
MSGVSAANNDPLRSGLVTIRNSAGDKPKKQKDEERANARIADSGLSIAVSSKVSAVEVAAQLAWLGIKSIDSKEISKIAGRNHKIDLLELSTLDQYLEATLSDDRDFMLAAVKRDSQKLEFASERLRGDKELVMAAVDSSIYSIFPFVAPSLKNDKGFVLEYLREKREQVKQQWANIYFDLNETQQQDRDIILAIIAIKPQTFKVIDPIYQNDRAFILDAVKLNAETIKYINPSLLEGEDSAQTAGKEENSSPNSTVLRLVNANGKSLKYLDAGYQKNHAVVFAAVKNSGEAIFYADPSLQLNEEILFAALKQDPSLATYSNCPDNIVDALKDKEFVLKMAEKDIGRLAYADSTLKKDAEFMLSAVRRWNKAHLYADDSLKKNREYVKKAVVANPWTFYYVDESLRKDKPFMLELLTEMKWKLPTTNGKYLILDRKIYLGLRSLNIEFPQRLGSMRSLLEIVHNRQNLAENDPRPMIVLLYPKADYNGAFAATQMEELVQKGYRVIYFEGGTDEEDYANLIAATRNVGKKTMYIEWSGHGTAEKIAKGAADPAQGIPENEDLYIDLTDEKEMKDLKLEETIDPAGMIIVTACSAGAGRETSPNMANMFAKIFKVPIKAPVLPTNSDHYVYDAEGKIVDVVFSGDPALMYSANPKIMTPSSN